MAKAQYQAQIDQAQQTASQAGPLAQAKAQQDVLTEQAKVATAQAELRAPATGGRSRKAGRGRSGKGQDPGQGPSRCHPAAGRSDGDLDGVVLERMLVEKMPEILGAAAGELRQANVTILNGAEGLGDLVAGLAAQATSILDIVRRGNGKFSALAPVRTTPAEGPPGYRAGPPPNPSAP